MLSVAVRFAVICHAMPTSFKADLRRYPLFFALWTILGLFHFSQAVTQRMVQPDPTPWWRYLVAWLLGVYVWALLTPVILWLGRILPIERRNWVQRASLHLLLAAVFSVFELGVESALYTGLHLFPALITDLRSTFAFLLIRGFHGGILNYAIVLGVQWGVLYYHRYQERSQEILRFELRASELQTQLVSARLNALKMQLQPHFLFNTLNAITVLVRQRKHRDAEQMLGSLSDLLRGVLQDVEAQEVTLLRELEYLQLYLAIERVRFPDRLRVELAIDPATEEALIPQLVLQPLVENAIRHGMGRSASAGRIQIGSVKINGKVQVRVEDDGPGLDGTCTGEEQGIGMANTRARLKQLYGDDARLDIENGETGGAIVTMTFPFHSASQDLCSSKH